MRQPRFKIRNEAAFYHCYNRVSGTRADRPFGRTEKAAFVRLIHRLSRFFVVDVVGYQVMSNHFHLLLYTPQAPPPAEDVCRRYAAFYPSRPPLDPQSEECARIGRRMVNFSEFVGDLQQQFSVWFNRTRTERRRGSLWADRFKNTLLGGGKALWACWAYIEMNPVRAHMVTDPSDYRFSSYGAWSGTGKHPFSGRPGVEHAFESLTGLFGVDSVDALRSVFNRAFLAKHAVETQRGQGEVEEDVLDAGKPLPFHMKLHRHCRYWADGLVIGTELFIHDAVAQVRGSSTMRKRRLRGADTHAELYSFRTLRVRPG